MVSFQKSWKTSLLVSRFKIFGNKTKLTVLYNINTKGFQKKFQQQESLLVKGHPSPFQLIREAGVLYSKVQVKTNLNMSWGGATGPYIGKLGIWGWRPVWGTLWTDRMTD